MIAAIQAGGRSSRMGRDKAWLKIDGQTLLSRALAATRPIAHRRMIVIRESSENREDYANLAASENASLIFDEFEGNGPLGVIHAALKAAGRKQDVLIMACDLPFVTTEFLTLLRDAHNGNAKAITVPVDPGGRLQPLLAIYSSDCLDLVEDHINRKLLRVDLLYDQIATQRVVPTDYAHLVDPRRVFVNVNEPSEFERIIGAD